MKLAPIVVFGFNRPEAISKTIESLKQDSLSAESDLFVFVDGPRNFLGEEEKVQAVNLYANSITGFKSLKVFSSNVNKGLGSSLIQGISKVISEFGSAIIVEDDLQIVPVFLGFMNQSLWKYRDNPKVFSICGYTNRIVVPLNYPYSTYFCTRSSSWGWATWKDRWDSVDWKLEPWEDFQKYKKSFNCWGGSDCFGMLKGWHEGRNKSWAIRFCFSQFLQNKVSLFPFKSFVINTGFDGNGTNCKKWSRFKYELIDPKIYPIIYPENVEINPLIFKSAMKYHSIPQRVLSKLMYLIS